MGSNEGSRNVKWVDGLRGIASFMVIMTHLARAWDPELFLPRDLAENSTPRILQWPILRVPWQGRIGVTIFAFLTGFVCALKPLRLARAGQPSNALSSVAKSAFRRAPRLILPATIAMAIAWSLCQLGAFKTAVASDSQWLRDASPRPTPTLWEEIVRFGQVWLHTWTNGHMDYDDHQWAILPLLKGSYMVYAVLFATVYAKYHFRLVVYAGMYYYFWQNPAPETETFGMQFFLGMFLADISNHPPAQAFLFSRRGFSTVISPLLIILGLYVASYPAERVETVSWSARLFELHRIFPQDAHLPKRFTALGTDICIVAIFLSPVLREMLSNRIFLFFGKVSFAVYLTHGTLLRTVLTWMLYGTTTGPSDPPLDHNGAPVYLARRGWPVTAISIPIWLCVVYTVAYLWTVHVDAWCARLTGMLEQFVFEEEACGCREKEKAEIGGGSGNGSGSRKNSMGMLLPQ